MEKINQRLSTMFQTLQKLSNALNLFQKYKTLITPISSEENEKIFLGMRDSLIQRFEYSTDLFWKLLKIYLEEIERINIYVTSPRGIIREMVRTKIITEEQGSLCMEMVQNRNETSHIYHQEVADNIAQKVPQFYTLMLSISTLIEQKIKQ